MPAALRTDCTALRLALHEKQRQRTFKKPDVQDQKPFFLVCKTPQYKYSVVEAQGSPGPNLRHAGVLQSVTDSKSAMREGPQTTLHCPG